MRAAPAKNRNRSTQTAISSIAAPTGLPAFCALEPAELVAARLEGVGDLEEEQRAVLRRRVLPGLEGRLGGVRPRDRRPRRRDAGTLAMTWPFAGFSMSSVSPLADSTNSPPMSCWYVLTRSITSVTRVSSTVFVVEFRGRGAVAARKSHGYGHHSRAPRRFGPARSDIAPTGGAACRPDCPGPTA